MELLALFAIALSGTIGWLICRIFLERVVSVEQRLYFAPAIGLGVCGVVAYLAVLLHRPRAITIFCLGVLLLGGAKALRMPRSAPASIDSRRLARFTILVSACVYGMQIVLYWLFSAVHPGPHEVWSLFALTGTSPPDQMFAWHQAMFFDQHRIYPQQPFYADMDLYDRPQFGGCITLFFFKLFRLPLEEKQFAYPASALHFYHCLWWLLNNPYLFGVAPLFYRLFSLRGAILAVSSTAVGGFFLLCNAGAWMKFSSAYPYLLAIVLFVEGSSPVLQALLCAMSYYIHGSVIPFLVGFGALHILNLRYPLTVHRPTWRSVALFSSVGTILVGAWFVTVRLVGSKQPIFYYYIYGAGLTEAQTRSVADIAHDFYSRYTWGQLSWFPIHNLIQSFSPTQLCVLLSTWISGKQPVRLSDAASTIFWSQRFYIACALGIAGAPLVIVGCLKTLARRYRGMIAFCLYLIPTLTIALIYRIEWAFSLHVIPLYHTLVLFCWVTVVNRVTARWALLGITAIAAEGAICVLFADMRFLPVTGLRINDLLSSHGWKALAYVLLIVCIVLATARELKRAGLPDSSLPLEQQDGTLAVTMVAGRKIAIGAAVVAAAVGAYAVYCRRFY